MIAVSFRESPPPAGHCRYEPQRNASLAGRDFGNCRMSVPDIPSVEIKDENGKSWYQVTHDYVLTVSTQLGFVRQYRIPKGHRWDGASIPRLLWRIVGHPMDDRFKFASCIHDLNCEESVSQYQRREADSIFEYHLYESGVGRIRCSAMWLGCRLWALVFWPVWRKLR